ncbi:hypothetical protein A2239_03330 [Candidatus Uhrbacteria bacterium RIFOXYA2_FULL_40_9]|nr:MAG: hypothetical protein UT94_C0029G0012 [Candidatus Uhrbacteria bacterium GW2011_GWF2_40_263]OGL92134.1 MAG: hypothetical protein A2239_03330 [Candidatus Uhrbacteria bacterium RIFOXYA2_FULL_40_9]OGL97873.1 MAG: hypothetical protein A2332_01775 [Candidatus Uhrbacteria bacterium RIFOXYB2_FULL_41_18]HCB56302.1 hypothetical protein [Candidatus Uhrbacteria bacterium]
MKYFLLSLIGLLALLLIISLPSKSTVPQQEQPPLQLTYLADDFSVYLTPNQTISSPLTITGQARGSWFFEATAPVVLVDWDGLIIAQGYIQTTEDWMTTEFVPFEGTLEFEIPSYKNNGAIIFHNDNPSGLPEHDRAVEIPIFYESSSF